MMHVRSCTLFLPVHPGEDSVTWQVRVGRKSGLFKSAVVLFPLTGKSDRKWADRERRGHDKSRCSWIQTSHLRGSPEFLPVWSCWSPGT